MMFPDGGNWLYSVIPADGMYRGNIGLSDGHPSARTIIRQRPGVKDAEVKQTHGNTLGAVAALLIGCAGVSGCAAAPADTGLIAATAPTSVPASAPGDQFLIVDCQLPGQIRQLGSRVTYAARGQLIRTDAQDCQIRGGEYAALDPSSYEASLARWLPIAEGGDPQAQNFVGVIYEQRLATPQPEKAAPWYRQAAELGYGPAQINLSRFYENGLGGLPRDPEAAVAWYSRATGLDPGTFARAEDVARLERQLAAKEEELTRLRGRLSRSAQSLDATQAELTRLRRQRSALVAPPAAVQPPAADLRQKQAAVADQESRIAEQKQQLEALSRERARLRDETQALRERQAALAAAVASGESAGADQSARLQDLTEALSQREAELARLETQRLRQQNALADSETALAARRAELADLERQVSRLSEQSAEKQAEVARLDTQIQRKQDEVAAQQTQLASLEDALSKRRQELADLDYQTRSATVPIQPAVNEDIQGIDFGRYHALIIGNNDYRNLPDLNTAVNDARELNRVLTSRYGYQTTLLENASRDDILKALNAARKRLTEQDNLLIYYAGHGEVVAATGRGYWLPVDADRDDSTNWITTISITDILKEMSAKHVLVIADSCYSGTLLRSTTARLTAGMSSNARRKYLEEIVGKRSRMALTSGGEEPVRDNVGGAHSVFAANLLRILENNTEALDGWALFENLYAGVNRAARNFGFDERPEYGPVTGAAHNGGDFVFVPKGQRDAGGRPATHLAATATGATHARSR